jgi:ubiquinone/menaquinone biosynthesis C-methylase UbiE
MLMASLFWPLARSAAQQESARPGINDAFRDPDVAEFVERFEGESREIFVHRLAIVEACRLKRGMVVADVGAGTGLFTRLFADAVGGDGRVLAVDISQKFLDHIDETCREAGLRNVQTVLGTADSTKLPAGAVDVAFICDTYHHFEFPQKTMASIRRALKPAGRVIVIDFQRIPGQSSDWVLEHVRAGQEVVEHEIVQAGFRRVDGRVDELNENYFMAFELAAAPAPDGEPVAPSAGGVAEAQEANQAVAPD